MNSGKVLTISILLIAAVAAGVAWWHNMNKGQRSLAFWSGSVAHRIRTAESVELWVLKPSDSPAELDQQVSENRQIKFGQQSYEIANTVDISQAPGLVHARQALISDASFDWQEPREATQPRWQFGIRFSSDSRSSVVLLDLESGLTALGERPEPAAKLGIAAGLAEFLFEQLQRK